MLFFLLAQFCFVFLVTFFSFFSLTYLLTYWSEYKKYSYSKKRKELKY